MKSKLNIKCMFMPCMTKGDIVETFIIAYLTIIKRLLRNSKTGVLSSTDVLPYAVKLCFGRRSRICDARMSYSACGQNLSGQVKC